MGKREKKKARPWGCNLVRCSLSLENQRRAEGLVEGSALLLIYYLPNGTLFPTYGTTFEQSPMA